MVSMPHPPSSLDLAPSDFYLFLIVKERFKYAGITHKDQSVEGVHKILRWIPGEELKKIFEAWRERVQNVNQGDGGCIDSETLWQYNALIEAQHKKLAHILIHQTIR
jgi:hypothetical protein